MSPHIATVLGFSLLVPGLLGFVAFWTIVVTGSRFYKRAWQAWPVGVLCFGSLALVVVGAGLLSAAGTAS